MKRLDDHGADTTKIDATHASIRKILTKIDICIKAADAISSRIHRLREEELQPQLSELIHGYPNTKVLDWLILLQSIVSL